MFKSLNLTNTSVGLFFLVYFYCSCHFKVFECHKLIYKISFYKIISFHVVLREEL